MSRVPRGRPSSKREQEITIVTKLGNSKAYDASQACHALERTAEPRVSQPVIGTHEFINQRMLGGNARSSPSCAPTPIA